MRISIARFSFSTFLALPAARRLHLGHSLGARMAALDEELH
jgi:hypothetical protein